MRSRNVAWLTALSLICGPAVADFPAATSEFNAGHYDNARAEFLTLAELGDPSSQFNLGAMAMQGQGVRKDLGAAVGWLTAAAENGSHRLTDEKLMALRAKLDDAGRADADRIVAQYGRSALLKTVLPVPSLRERCGSLTPARALEVPHGEYPSWARYGNQNGFVIIELTIGTDGVARDPEVLMAVPGPEFGVSAINTWVQAHFAPASQEDRPVETRTTVKSTYVMQNGVGVLWDVEKLKAILETAKTGDPEAQYKIGLAATLDSSLGIPANQAHQLMISAAQGGNPKAQYWAARRFASVGSCGVDEKRLPWLRAAAAAGNPPAQLALAAYLLEGQPAPEQQAQARALLEQAAQSDNYYVMKHVIALLAASSVEALHDPATARAVAARLAKSGVEWDPQMYEVLAAADAANGDFWAAGNNQWSASKRARDLHWNTTAIDERLALYRKSKPWRGDLFAVVPPLTPPPAAAH